MAHKRQTSVRQVKHLFQSFYCMVNTANESFRQKTSPSPSYRHTFSGCEYLISLPSVWPNLGGVFVAPTTCYVDIFSFHYATLNVNFSLSFKSQRFVIFLT